MRWAYVDSQLQPSQTLTPQSQATKGYELVVRSISTVGNYDYLVRVIHSFPWSPVLIILICSSTTPSHLMGRSRSDVRFLRP
jgi:hypothetical protein